MRELEKNCHFLKSIYYETKLIYYTLMKYNSLGTSIVEAMVVMLIVVIGIVWMYGILSSSQKLSDMTHNRIEAIQIAREGIEAIMNIRDTNALLFQADLANCWNVLNYDTNCLSDATTAHDIPHTGDFVIYQDTNFRWMLSQKSYAWADDYFNINYKNAFQVRKNGDFYTQTGWTDFLPLFTRDIKITYLDNITNAIATDSNTDKMKIQSIVRWTDTSSKKPYEIVLETVLTNWKKGN